jgi:hypothetical protein
MVAHARKKSCGGAEKGVHVDPIQTAPGSTEAQTITEEAYQPQLANLAKLWGEHLQENLKLRHQTGALLNLRFGNPHKRQNRDEGVMKQVSEQLGVAESELSRMRHFAWHFKSFEDFKAEHAKVTTWTDVKELIPTLKAKGQQQGPRAVSSTTLKRSLDKLSSKVQQVPMNLSDSEKKAILEMFKKVAQAVENCLKIHVSIEDQPVESNPVAPSTNEAPETVPVLG